MLRTIFIFALATAVMAEHTAGTPEQIIRIGSVGTTFTHVKGVLVPTAPTLVKGLPAYEFKNIVGGTAAVETDKIHFRCSMLSDFYVPHVENPKPVLLCRNDAFEKSTVTDSGAEKMAFLFSAEELALPKGIHDIELVLGKGMWKTLVTSHAATFSGTGTVKSLRMEGLYDGYKVLTTMKPYETMLTYDIPTTRVKRQFGGGFSGSGAQAGASSFGGGGGFGGFPGGGFGGGFSGSQASAGAGSIGGGGFFG